MIYCPINDLWWYFSGYYIIQPNFFTTQINISFITSHSLWFILPLRIGSLTCSPPKILFKYFLLISYARHPGMTPDESKIVIVPWVTVWGNVCNHPGCDEALSIAHQSTRCHEQVLMTSLNDNPSWVPTEPPFLGKTYHRWLWILSISLT